MTEQEAIEELSNEIRIITDMISYCRNFEDENDIALAYLIKEKDATEMAIIALKEIQQYRKIGTVEECRKAREKQMPKKPRLNYKPKFFGEATYTCPKCGNFCLKKFANERQNNSYCWNCGQAIDWSDDLEGTKDE